MTTNSITPIRLSDEAWAHLQALTKQHEYNGTALWQGTANFIVALLRANPTPTSDWIDSRPQALKQHDAIRITSLNKLPLWFFDGNTRLPHQHKISKHTYERIEPLAIPIADHFGIRSVTNSSPKSIVNCLLEAIGLKHLTPVHPPARCLAPAKRPGRTRKPAFELVF